ncbi:hypothetical protein [uncultured Sphingomonas sp.]|uniref:hypothetical protein n=1 Tax=uncultured Sphingomonas sp. TaxID=158754 RepID=UPI0035CB1381
MRLSLCIAALVSMNVSPAHAAVTPRGQTIAIACAGPVAVAARKVAITNGIKLGSDPKACFGKMQIFDGPSFQYVVVVPSVTCPGGKAVDVYGKSNAGSWYSYFEKPVCGSRVSIGPENQWGDWMITVDGKHYDSRGAYYILVP